MRKSRVDLDRVVLCELESLGDAMKRLREGGSSGRIPQDLRKRFVSLLEQRVPWAVVKARTGVSLASLSRWQRGQSRSARVAPTKAIRTLDVETVQRGRSCSRDAVAQRRGHATFSFGDSAITLTVAVDDLSRSLIDKIVSC